MNNYLTGRISIIAGHHRERNTRRVQFGHIADDDLSIVVDGERPISAIHRLSNHRIK